MRRQADQLEERYCDGCKQRFVGPRWHRFCKRCYFDRTDAERQRRNYDQGWHEGHVAALRAGALRGLEPELLRKTIRLCHPDAQPEERRALANEVTAQLLELRELVAA